MIAGSLSKDDAARSPRALATAATPSPAHQPDNAKPGSNTSAPGPVILETEPLLAVPLHTDGFTLESAGYLPANVPVGFSANYVSSSKSTLRLTATVMVTKSGVPLDPVGKNDTAMKIGTHDGVLTAEDDKDQKSLIAEWVSGSWHANVMVEYQRTSDSQACRRTPSPAAAATVSELLDRYLRRNTAERKLAQL